MFTGIVEETGTVASVRRGASSAVLTVSARKVLEGTKIGDSIAVNGVCLTVTELSGNSFSADVMHETLDRSSLSSASAGTPVNLERAMAADGRFGGHIVSGHIDGTGIIGPDAGVIASVFLQAGENDSVVGGCINHDSLAH